MSSQNRRCVCALLVVSITVDLVILPCATRLVAQDAPAPRGGSNDAETREARARLERLFQGLQRSLREEPADPVDLQGVIAKTGRDPGAIFAWVRDRIALTPYLGALRGAPGTLLDRAGNGLDRALLLAELLRSTGSKVRLAHATLPEEAARGLLEKLPRSLPSLIEPARSDPATVAAPSAAAPLLRRIEDCAQAVSEHTGAILKRMPDDLVRQAPETEGTAALAALRDHWWVEREEKGVWIDQDLLSLDAAARPEPQYVLPGPGGFTLEDRLWHEVEVRVLVEQWKDGALFELPALKKSFRPAEHLLEKISLRHVPLDWPQGLEPFAEKEGMERLKKTIAQVRRWLPILSIGDTEHSQLGFTDTGEVQEGMLRGEARFARGVGVAAGGLDAALGGEPASSESQLTAVWLECEVRSPGLPPRTIRRELFDFFGPVQRQAKAPAKLELTDMQRLDRGLALLGDMEILAQVCRLPGPFLTRGIARGLLENRGVLERTLEASAFAGPSELFSLMGAVKPVPGGLHLLAFLRSQLSRHESAVFFASPSVLTFRRFLAQQGKADLAVREGFDILANGVEVLPGSGTSPFLVRMEQGILDTNLEAMLMRGAGTVENTAELLAGSATQGVDWLLVRDPAELRQAGRVVPDDARVRMERELAAGNVLVAPARPLRRDGKDYFGWWRIDPRSGTSLGMMETGMGQSLTERIVLTAFLMGPTLGAGWLGFVGCAGKDYANNSAGKNAACFFCGLLAATCVFGAMLSFMTAGTSGAAIIAFCGKNVVGLVVGGAACSAAGAYAR